MKNQLFKLTLAIFAFSFLTPKTSIAQISSNGLIAWYPFYENCKDASGNGNNGTLQGGVSLSQDRFGITDYAYNFDGLALTYIDCGNSSTFDIQSGGLSVSAWIYPVAGGAGLQAVMSKASANTNNVLGTYELYLENRVPKFAITHMNGSPWYTICNTSDTLNYGQWYYLTAIADASSNELRIYIDGQLKSSTAWSGTYYGGQQKLLIGSNYKSNFASQYMYNFSGKIDNVRLYNRAISANEIQALYNEELCHQTITVTDTLIINHTITGFNPLAYQNTIKIFPNPTNDVLNMDFGSNFATMNGYTLKIMNSLSQVVYTTPINAQTNSVNMSLWANGIYFVHLIDNSNNIVDIRKIVLQ